MKKNKKKSGTSKDSLDLFKEFREEQQRNSFLEKCGKLQHLDIDPVKVWFANAKKVPMEDKITKENRFFYTYCKSKYPDIDDIVLRRMVCRAMHCEVSCRERAMEAFTASKSRIDKFAEGVDYISPFSD